MSKFTYNTATTTALAIHCGALADVQNEFLAEIEKGEGSCRWAIVAQAPYLSAGKWSICGLSESLEDAILDARWESLGTPPVGFVDLTADPEDAYRPARVRVLCAGETTAIPHALQIA